MTARSMKSLVIGPNKDALHRMSAPTCQSKPCSGLEPVFRIGALLPALIGDLDRWVETSGH